MNANKLLNKLRYWVLDERPLQKELHDAEEEFFCSYTGSKPENFGMDTLGGLFYEWFLFDRKTTGYMKTPLEIFIKYSGRKLSKPERKFYAALQSTIFGIFEVGAVDGAHDTIMLTRLDLPGTWAVKDHSASANLKQGDILITRLAILDTGAIMTGWCSRLPAAASKFSEFLKAKDKAGAEQVPIKSREVLQLFSGSGAQKGIDAFTCRARLSALWQSLGISEPFSSLEQAVEAGDFSKVNQLRALVLGHFVNSEKIHEVTELLNNYWNLAAGVKNGEKPPMEKAKVPPGPVEREFLNELGLYAQKNHESTGKGPSKEDTDAWLRNPSNGKDGISPFELIAAERRHIGHPSPESIGYAMEFSEITPADRLVEAQEKGNLASALMIEKEFAAAAKLYEESYKVIKHHHDVAFRVLGNLGICYAVMGQREKAAEALRAALKCNPSYDLARQHLANLESMSDKQYAEFVKNQGKKITMVKWREKE